MNQLKFEENTCSWHKSRENVSERVTRTTCGSWRRISRSHSYDPPLACVLRSSLRSSPRIVAQKRDCSQSKRIQQVFRTLLSMRSSPDPRTNRENCLRVLRKDILVLTDLLRWLICQQDPLSSTANPNRGFVVWGSIWRLRQNGRFIRDRDTRLSTGEYNRLSTIVMSCISEKPIFKDGILAVHCCKTSTASCPILVKEDGSRLANLHWKL